MTGMFNEMDFKRLRLAVGTMAFFYEQNGGVEHKAELRELNEKLKRDCVQLNKREVGHCKSALHVMAGVAKKEGKLDESKALDEVLTRLAGLPSG